MEFWKDRRTVQNSAEIQLKMLGGEGSSTIHLLYAGERVKCVRVHKT
jgi:hypothetical protein